MVLALLQISKEVEDSENVKLIFKKVDLLSLSTYRSHGIFVLVSDGTG